MGKKKRQRIQAELEEALTRQWEERLRHEQDHIDDLAFSSATLTPLEPGLRPSWITTFFDLAEVVARRATCPRLRVGAVVVSQKRRVLTTGYNGAPRWQPHCTEVGCDMVDGHCQRVVHAELNAVLQGAEAGISLTGATLYTLYQPCVPCTLALVQVGIEAVFYQRAYGGDREKIAGILRTANATLHGPFPREGE